MWNMPLELTLWNSKKKYLQFVDHYLLYSLQYHGHLNHCQRYLLVAIYNNMLTDWPPIGTHLLLTRAKDSSQSVQKLALSLLQNPSLQLMEQILFWARINCEKLIMINRMHIEFVWCIRKLIIIQYNSKLYYWIYYDFIDKLWDNFLI